MDAHETTGEIMNEVDWKKDGEEGCLMGLVKVGALTVLLAAVMAVSYAVLAPKLVDLWW